MFIQSLKIALWLAAIIFLSLYVRLNADPALRLFDNIDPLIYSLLALNVVVSWLLRSVRDLIIYRSMGCKIAYANVLVLNNQQVILNYLPMKLGSIHLAAQLRQKYDFSYSGIAGSFLLQQVLVSIVASVCSVLAILLFSAHYDTTAIILVIVFAVVAAVLMLGLLLDVRISWFPDFINRSLMGVHAQIRQFSQSASQLRSSMLVSVGMYALAVLRIYLLCVLLELDVSAAAVVLFASVSQLSLFFAITPAGLGVREFFMGALTSLFGLSAATGVILSLAERFVVLALALVFLLLATTVNIYWTKHGCEK